MVQKVLFFCLIVLIGAGVYVMTEIRPPLERGAGYAARMVCSCVYVSNRTFDACLADLDPQVKTLNFDQTDEPEGFIVGLFPLVSRSVVHEQGYGCRLID